MAWSLAMSVWEPQLSTWTISCFPRKIRRVRALPSTRVRPSEQRRGLPTHEEVRGSRRFTVLRWAFDGEERALRPNPKRAWRFVLAVRFTLEHP